MKTTTDPGRHAELRYYSNHHHGIRGLNPTSGFAEALSPCLPPQHPSAHNTERGRGRASAPGTPRRAAARCRAQDMGETRSAAGVHLPADGTSNSICIALLREGRGLGLNTQQALKQGGLRATGRAGPGAQVRGPGKPWLLSLPDLCPRSSIL